jgi:hypothetical protein
MAHTIDGVGIPKLEIHSETDGKLFKYGITTRFSISDKKRLIGCLIDVVRDRANEQVRDYGVRGLQIIQESAGCAPNFQVPDGIYADDILCEICEILTEVKNEEIINTAINHISEQMKDAAVTNGWCSTGRASRSMNVYMFLRDYKDGIHLPKGERKEWKEVNQ